MTHSFPTRRSSDLQHAFVQAVRGLDNHPEHQAIAYVVDRKLHLSSEQVGKAWPECFRSVGEIVVEAGARATAGTSPRRHQLAKFATHFVCSRVIVAKLGRSEEHTSELQSLMRNSYAVFCLKKKNQTIDINNIH